MLGRWKGEITEVSTKAKKTVIARVEIKQGHVKSFIPDSNGSWNTRGLLIS